MSVHTLGLQPEWHFDSHFRVSIVLDSRSKSLKRDVFHIQFSFSILQVTFSTWMEFSNILPATSSQSCLMMIIVTLYYFRVSLSSVNIYHALF